MGAERFRGEQDEGRQKEPAADERLAEDRAGLAEDAAEHVWSPPGVLFLSFVRP